MYKFNNRFVCAAAVTVMTLGFVLPGGAQGAPDPGDLGQSDAQEVPRNVRYNGNTVLGSIGSNVQLGMQFDGVYTTGKNNPDRAEVRSVEITIGAPVDPYFDLTAHIGIHPVKYSRSTARDVDAGLSVFELEEAYASTPLPFGLRAQYGLELMPFGDMNQLHDPDLPQIDRPRVLEEFFDHGLRGVGGHLEWTAPIANPTLSLIGGAYNRAEGENNGGGDFFDDHQVFYLRRGNRGPLLLGRIASFLGWGEGRHGLRVGGSYVEDKNEPTGRSRSSVAGADVKYRWVPDASGRQFVLAGEYLRHDREETPTHPDQQTSGQNGHTTGFYAYGHYDHNSRWGLGYRFDRSNTAFGRPFGGQTMAGGAGVAGSTLKAEFEAHSIYAEYRPSEFTKLRAQYRNDAQNFARTDRAGLRDRSDDVFTLQVIHQIGWHPAHKF